MHGGPNDEGTPAVPDGVRASDGDRERVVARLRVAAGDGLLDLTELEDRLSAAYAARTLSKSWPRSPPICPDRAPRSRTTVGARRRRLPPPPHRVRPGDRHAHRHLAARRRSATSGRSTRRPAGASGSALHRRARAAHRAAQARGRRPVRSDRPPLDPAADRPALSTGGSCGAERRPSPPVRRRHVRRRGRLHAAQRGARRRAVGRRPACATARWSTQCMTRHGGWEANAAGDGVLARFEDPEAAARAAVELLRRASNAAAPRAGSRRRSASGSTAATPWTRTATSSARW